MAEVPSIALIGAWPIETSPVIEPYRIHDHLNEVSIEQLGLS